jgi:hypothetical protein
MSIITQEMRQKGTTRRPITLKQFSMLLKEESLENLPNRLLIDLDAITREELWSLIELMRFKPNGQALIHRLVELGPSPSDHLKNLISIGKSSLAQEFVADLKLESDPQLVLQRISLLLFDGYFQKALDLSLSLTEDPRLPLSSRGMLMRFAGQALLEVGEVDRAKIYFEAALDLSVQMGDFAGRFSILLFLAKCAAAKNRSALSHSYLEKSADILHRHNLNLHFYLDYYRCLAHARGASQTKTVETLLLTSRMAQCLGDPLSEGQGYVEAGLVCGSSLGEADRGRLMERIQELGLPPHHDFDNWMAAFRGDEYTQGQSYGFNKILAHFQIPQPDFNFREMFKLVDLAQWFYDPETNFFIDLVEGRVEALIKDSPSEKLLTQLTRNNGTMTVEAIFESVWKIKWHPGRHMSVLKMAVFRFNQIKAGLKINRREGSLELSHPGIILGSV